MKRRANCCSNCAFFKVRGFSGWTPDDTSFTLTACTRMCAPCPPDDLKEVDDPEAVPTEAQEKWFRENVAHENEVCDHFVLHDLACKEWIKAARSVVWDVRDILNRDTYYAACEELDDITRNMSINK